MIEGKRKIIIICVFAKPSFCGQSYQPSQPHNKFSSKSDAIMGSGFGTVDSMVASDTRGPGFESSHWPFSLNNFLLLTFEE